MPIFSPPHFHLQDFEGPLDLLWQLVQSQELNILDIPIVELFRQFDSDSLDQSAEFVALAALLIWHKSKALLPEEAAAEETPLPSDLDAPFANIQYLVDYCRFKQAAKDLSKLEEKQEAFYPRGTDPDAERQKNLGIEHLSLEDLNTLFQQLLKKCASQKSTVYEDRWKVEDKINQFREIFTKQKSVPFITMFTIDQCREELIVTFLALLELMKAGEARVVKNLETDMVVIQNPKGADGKRDQSVRTGN
jgi:segregation and condensation protein A